MSEVAGSNPVGRSTGFHSSVAQLAEYRAVNSGVRVRIPTEEPLLRGGITQVVGVTWLNLLSKGHTYGA